MQLRSPYGDPLSIMQTNYFPLACILGLTLPRAVGSNAYTSPFLIRAYCKGMFSIPLGMIRDCTVDRGRDSHGWSIGRLPTSMDISFSIINMSPKCYMAMGDSTGLYSAVLGETSVFQEYLSTLSGMGLMERLDSWERVKTRATIWLQTAIHTQFNPAYLGMKAGSFPIIKGIYNLLPGSKLLAN